MATAQGEERSSGFPNACYQILLNEQNSTDDDVDDYDDDEVTCGGGERPLGEKLPDGLKVKTPMGGRNLTGAIELHRLALEDYAQLERRAGELKAEFINSTCTRGDGYIKEVSQPILPFSPGDATVPRLLRLCLGLGALAPEQGRRSQQGGEMERWICGNPPVLCSWLWLHRGLQAPPQKWG